ncbi:MAG: hypothetical protein J6A15_09335 [Clostridia bacterium]|nr:hypothetical protein [Clostridia bacterium]
MKKIICIFILMISIFTSVVIFLDYKKENDVNLELQNYDNVKSEVILENCIDADLAVDYSNIKNLVRDSEIIAIVEINNEMGKNYNSVNKEYVPVYTTGELTIKEVLSNNSGVELSENNIIEYVRLGGEISYSEYIKGLTENERNKIEQNLTTYTTFNQEQLYSKTVKEFYTDDVEIESGKEYLVFLKYTNDYKKYNIVGFEYGLREYDATTMQVKNNETNSFEKINDVACSMN